MPGHSHQPGPLGQRPRSQPPLPSAPWAPGWGRRRLLRPVCRSACVRGLFSALPQPCAHSACVRDSGRGRWPPLAPTLLGSIIYCFVAPPKRQLGEFAVGAAREGPGAPSSSVAAASGHIKRGTSRAPECGGPGLSSCRSCSVRDLRASAREPPFCGRVMGSGFHGGPA